MIETVEKTLGEKLVNAMKADWCFSCVWFVCPDNATGVTYSTSCLLDGRICT
jgi:hypothetical protein